MDQRRAAVEASKFANEVLQRALAGMAGADRRDWTYPPGPQVEDDPLDDDADEDGSRFLGADKAAEDALALVEDLEATLQTTTNEIDVPMEQEADVEAEQGGTLHDVDYVDLATSFMALLLDNTMTGYATWSQQTKTCALCHEDETVDDEKKVSNWRRSLEIIVIMLTSVRNTSTRLRSSWRNTCPAASTIQ